MKKMILTGKPQKNDKVSPRKKRAQKSIRPFKFIKYIGITFAQNGDLAHKKTRVMQSYRFKKWTSKRGFLQEIKK